MREANTIALFIRNPKIETHKTSFNQMTGYFNLGKGRFVFLHLKKLLNYTTT